MSDAKAGFSSSRTVLVGGSRQLHDQLCKAGMWIAAKIDDLDMLPLILRTCIFDSIVFAKGELVGGRKLEEAMDFVVRTYPGVKIAVLNEEGAPAKALAPSPEAPGEPVPANTSGAREVMETRVQESPGVGQRVPLDSLAAVSTTFSAGVQPLLAAESEVFPGDLAEPVAKAGLAPVTPRFPGSLRHESADTRRGRASVQPAAPRQEVVSIFSSKGGVGKTFIAINLAVILARHLKTKVLLMDMDTQLGDVGVHLDLLGGPTVIDVLPYGSQLNPDLFKKFVLRHPTSGLNVLLGINSPEYGELVSPQHVRRIIEVAQKCYDVCVIDTSGGTQSDVTLQCLEVSSRAILVATADTCCIRSVKVLMNGLLQVDPAIAQKTLLVLNRYDGSTPLNRAQVEAFLGVRVAGLVREGRREVEEAIYSGHALFERSPKSPICEDLLGLADILCPGIVEESSGLRPGLKNAGLMRCLSRYLPGRLGRR